MSAADQSAERASKPPAMASVAAAMLGKAPKKAEVDEQPLKVTLPPSRPRTPLSQREPAALRSVQPSVVEGDGDQIDDDVQFGRTQPTTEPTTEPVRQRAGQPMSLVRDLDLADSPSESPSDPLAAPLADPLTNPPAEPGEEPPQTEAFLSEGSESQGPDALASDFVPVDDISPDSLAETLVAPTTDPMRRGRPRVEQVDQAGRVVPRSGRVSTSITVPLSVRAAWTTYAETAGFSKNQVMMDAFDLLIEELPALAATEARRLGGRSESSIFQRRPLPAQSPQEPFTAVNLRIQADNLSVIDDLTAGTGLNRSQMITLVLREFLARNPLR